MFHPIDDCEHPLLYLPGIGIASQERAMSGSFQQNLAGVCNGVSVWRLIMVWIPGGQPLDGPSDIAVPCEAMPVPGKYRSGCSQ